MANEIWQCAFIFVCLNPKTYPTRIRTHIHFRKCMHKNQENRLEAQCAYLSVDLCLKMFLTYSYQRITSLAHECLLNDISRHFDNVECLSDMGRHGIDMRFVVFSLYVMFVMLRLSSRFCRIGLIFFWYCHSQPRFVFSLFLFLAKCQPSCSNIFVLIKIKCKQNRKVFTVLQMWMQC